MKYIVVDLEWNQPQNKKSKIFENNSIKLNCEIIQIGAIMLDENLNITVEFSSTIKPQYYTKLHREVSRVTRLTSDDLADGKSFPLEYDRFIRWCSDDFLFLSWGFDDIPILEQNTRFYGINFHGDHHFINLQLLFNHKFSLGKEQKSLSYATEFLELSSEIPFHDARNDAYYTALIAKHLDIETGKSIYKSLITPKKKKVKPVISDYISQNAGIFDSIGQIFSDSLIRDMRCPMCDCPSKSKVKWYKQHKRKYISLSFCPEHGEFFNRLKITKLPGDRLGATVISRTTTDENKKMVLNAKNSTGAESRSAG